ncbi:spore cortex-lytic enzyme [compost metagenome]|uniref:caspase family protein n=1 Tax=Ensifer sp. 22460 TaxID=3453922 RepID=UPI000DDA5644
MKWRTKLTSWVFSALIVLLAVGHALAEEDGKRLALIVGMSNYVVAGILPNASRDAEAFKTFLDDQGFEADLVLNTNRRGLAEALARFSRKIGPKDVALFYYAGHGMQLHGDNFLVATDARLESEFDVPAETMALSEIVNALEKRAKISLIFLDACRNNPLADRLNREVEGASRGGAIRGLAPIDTQGAGTLVAFAAAPGQVAADGTDGHSPFTRALIANLSGPGLEIGTAFKHVIREVRSETNGKQSPQILSSLDLEFYLGRDTAVREPAHSAATTVDLAALDFGKAMRVDTIRTWKRFIAKHGSGSYADAARQSVRRLGAIDDLRSPLVAMAQEQKVFDSREKRSSAQEALRSEGFDTGQTDGTFGGQTRRAVTSFQTARGLTQSGFLDQETSAALGLGFARVDHQILSAAIARRYDAADLKGLEDAAVVAMVRCLSPLSLTYGVFDGRLYAAAYDARQIGWQEAKATAERCGGHLATIESSDENAFVASLVNTDARFFNSLFEGGEHRRVGPWLGLVNENGIGDAWTWVTGAVVTYSRWFRRPPEKAGAATLYAAYRANKVPLAAYIDTWGARDALRPVPGFITEFE